MRYRRVLLTRWSRRDWLAVAVVALVTVFLVGATLALVTTQATVGQQAAGFETDATARFQDPSDAAAVDGDAIAVPLATATVDGDRVVVAGLPRDAPRTLPNASSQWTEARLPETPPPGEATGPVNATGTRTLVGSEGRETVRVEPALERSVLPPEWYVTDTGTVERLGTTGTLVIDRGGGTVRGGVPGQGTMLLAIGGYMLAGSGQLLRALALITVAAGVLGGVALYGITRMTIRDRRRALFVVRATGAAPRTLLAIFGVRAGLIAAAGVALGYALGIIVVNVAVNVAVLLGSPATLQPQVTASVAAVLVPSLLVLVAVGALAGLLAAWTALRTSPATLVTTRPAGRLAAGSGADGRGLRGRLTDLRLLSWRALAPTTAALTVFAAVLLLTASFGATVGPLVAPSTGVITDPGAPHPLASSVDRETAAQLERAGATTSPEILVPQVREGEPYLARGVEYDDYAALTDARLVAGRAPNGPREAVVGVDLARTLDLQRGETVTLGGGTDPGIARVTVVGTFRASGLQDDQLLLPLATAARLVTIREGTVNLVRVDGIEAVEDGDGDERTTPTGNGTATPDAPLGDPDDTIVITSLTVPERTTVEHGIPVTATVHNYGTEETFRDFEIRLDNETRTRRVRLAAGETKEINRTVEVERPGEYVIGVGGFRQRVTVVNASELVIADLPVQAPPNATLAVRVRTADDRPVEGARVTIGTRSARTAANGTALLGVPERPGEYAVSAATDDRSSPEQTLAVVAGAPRDVQVRLDVRPSRVRLGSQAIARLTVTNPWDRPQRRTIAVETPAGTRETTLTLGPTQRETVTVRLPEAEAGGRQRVVARIDGQERAIGSYRVVDDAGIVAALAASDRYTTDSAIGRGVPGIIGNLELVQATLLVLATLMIIGSTVSGFAQAVHARRRVIGVYRTTGATPAQVLRHVVVDATRVGIVATLIALPLAVVLLVVLARVDALVLFGVRIPPVPPASWLLVTAVAAVALAVLSACLATAALLFDAPVTLLAEASRATPPRRTVGEPGGGDTPRERPGEADD